VTDSSQKLDIIAGEIVIRRNFRLSL